MEEPTLETITYKRKKYVGQRDAKLENLPTETLRELKVIPAQVKVVEHIQHIYSCRQYEREAIETPIVTAKMPVAVFPKSLASPSVNPCWMLI